MNGIRPVPQGRGLHIENPPPGLTQQSSNMPGVMGNANASFGSPRDQIPVQSHSRQHSASLEKSNFEAPGTIHQPQPIGRPAPIQRPSSVVPQNRGDLGRSDIDDLSNHLGSSALLDDDEPDDADMEGPQRGNAAPGQQHSSRVGFGPSPFLGDHIGGEYYHLNELFYFTKCH